MTTRSDRSQSPESTSTMDTSRSSSGDVTTGVGLANPSLSQGRRRMLDLVNKLHSTGVQVDIDLPQIAVIGSQSAGKSSLIESISGITLPRAAGTCTRCPTECRLSYSPGRWQCSVSLRFITDAKGQVLGQARNEAFGPVIYNKGEVEERIRRAQRAILNPSQPFEKFLLGDDEDAKEPGLSFSTNCVSLQISGPDVADLSFCDLPGLIASVSGNGNNNDINLVQNLVNSYIQKPSCIILLTVACETDFENQGAHRLAKENDSEGRRTIGVLTKPDRIPMGEESSWLPFIRNEREPLENNWYCVKQPSSNDIKQNMTWEGARKSEDEFFSSVHPWSDLDPVYQKYLRTSNLVDRLSSILSDLIAKRLPEIQEELDRSIAVVRRQLEGLPKAPSNDPTSEVVSLIHNFARSLLEHVSGVPDVDGLIQRVRPLNERFRRAVRGTAPKFRPYEREHAGFRHIGPATFLRNEEDELYEDEVSDEEGGGVAQTSVGNKRRRENDKIYVDDVLERAHCARTRELPGNFPFVVQKSYITEILKGWSDPSIRLCNQIYDILTEYTRSLIHSHFGEFGQGLLEQRVRAVLQDHLKDCRDRALERVKWLLEVEEQPFSLNGHYFDDYRTKFLAYYRGARRGHGQANLMKQIEEYSGNKAAPPTTTAPPLPSPSVPTFNFNALFPSMSSGTPSPFGNPTPLAPRGTSHTSGSQAPARGSGSANASPVPARAQLPPPPHLPQAPAAPFFSNTSTTTGKPHPIAAALAALAELGLHGITPEDLPKLLPHDTMEPALLIMADVRAYFQVAYKRFADMVPLAIDLELVRGAERGILEVLYQKLGVHGPNGPAICKDLAQESPQVAHRRAQLVKKLERLTSANNELLTVGV